MSDTVCARPVHWHGENLDTVCQLPFGHQPSDQHSDGLWWFDNHGLRLPRCEPDLGRWRHNHGACRSQAVHGSWAGCQHHYQRGERPCGPCAEAARAQKRLGRIAS